MFTLRKAIFTSQKLVGFIFYIFIQLLYILFTVSLPSSPFQAQNLIPPLFTMIPEDGVKCHVKCVFVLNNHEVQSTLNYKSHSYDRENTTCM